MSRVSDGWARMTTNRAPLIDSRYAVNVLRTEIAGRALVLQAGFGVLLGLVHLESPSNVECCTKCAVQ